MASALQVRTRICQSSTREIDEIASLPINRSNVATASRKRLESSLVAVHRAARTPEDYGALEHPRTSARIFESRFPPSAPLFASEGCDAYLQFDLLLHP